MLYLIIILYCYFNPSNANNRVAPKLAPVVTNQQADVNASFQILCSVRQGAQPLFFEWYKNSRPIRSSAPRLVIENSKLFSTLMIEHIARDDTGNYTCLAKNIYGNNSINVILTVKGEIQFFIF